MPEFHIRTNAKRQMVDITDRVVDLSRQAGVHDGICHVYVPHATAAIVINENDDPNLCVDILDALERQIPDGIWRHDRIDNNGAAHIQAAILGPSESVPVVDGEIVLGTWQAIMLVELDGPRDRRLVVTVR